MEMDFRAFFLLGKIQFLKNISARGSFFMVGETAFLASGKCVTISQNEGFDKKATTGRNV